MPMNFPTTPTVLLSPLQTVQTTAAPHPIHTLQSTPSTGNIFAIQQGVIGTHSTVPAYHFRVR